MKILVPFYGDTARFRPLLDKWFAACASVPLSVERVALLTDEDGRWDATRASCDHGCEVWTVDRSGFDDLVRPGQPFDVKGALVCAALLRFKDALLVLDADATLERDPLALLEPLRAHVVSMPIDDGALTHGRQARLEQPWGHVAKHCAGVMFFPAHSGRSRLVSAYRKAWLELRGPLPWDGKLPHLLEQHAWSLASRRRGGGVLPRVMNWNPDFLGDNPAAVVVHRYGFRKWADAPLS